MARKSLVGALLASLHVINAQLTSTLFEHATVIIFNEETQSNEILHGTSVLIQGDTIAAIFPSSNDLSSPVIPPDTEIVPAKNTIISPGFIDTHRHTWQTTYRTLASNTTLAEYFVRWSPGTKATELFEPEDIYLSSLMGLYEALDAGVTSLIDHAHGIKSREDAEANLKATVNSGARVWFGYNLDPWSGMSLQDRAAHWLDILRDDTKTNDLVKLSVSFDYWNMAGNEDLQTALDLIKNNDIPLLTTHLVGGPYGAPNGPSLLLSHDLLNRSFPIVLSHATYITPLEHQLLRKHNHYVSITPESEMHFGHTNVESDLLMDQASLGVDTHATFSGDIITQARLWLQSVRHRSYRKLLDQWKLPSHNPMSVNQAFHLATRAGALALRRDDLGVIRVGAKADLVVFDGRSTNMVGWRDPIAAIILHSHVSDVKHVMVGGKFVKRDGKLAAKDLDEVTEKFAESAKKIQDQAVEFEFDIDKTFLAYNGLPLKAPDQVDATRGYGTGY
nr:amidohydrolase family protein [Colletotrichum truncatum]KAF6793163.1 amidohydrolase family protein [Colletotrichum truncatum]